jgi:hypothetical protein
MKNIVHLFSREVVVDFLDCVDAQSRRSRNFEFMAPLLMQRVYEKEWGSPTMIGFYMNPRYASILENAESVNRTLQSMP